MSAILPALVLLPLAAAVATASLPAARTRAMAAIAIPFSLVMAALVGVAAAGVHGEGELRTALAGWDAPLGIELRADGLSIALLGLTALVGVAVTVYATGGDAVRGGPLFWPLWFALWAALNAVYLAADLFNGYVALELMGIAAVSLVALGGPAALGPALRYLFVAVLGSLAYLLAVALVYGQTGTLDLALAAEALEPGPLVAAVLVLVTVGLAFKTALFPLHSWLPAAHSSAPSAVSAVLSALVVKASLYLLVRIWFALLGEGVVGPELTEVLAPLLGALGAAAVLWGSILALRERRLKRIVAYSTVAQLGYLFLLFPLVTAGADAGSQLADGARAAWMGGIAIVLAHGVAKAAMFLAAGALTIAHGSDEIDALRGAVSTRPLSVAAFAIAGGSLAGIPPTFGFVAKWQLLDASLGTGQWWWMVVLLGGGLLTFAYTARVVRATFSGAEEVPEATPRPPGEPASASVDVPLPRVLVIVPIALAALSIVLGLVSVPLLELLDAAYPFAAAAPGTVGGGAP